MSCFQSVIKNREDWAFFRGFLRKLFCSRDTKLLIEFILKIPVTIQVGQNSARRKHQKFDLRVSVARTATVKPPWMGL
jgi:hypothetical protein